MCFAYKPYNEACLGCAKSRSGYSKAMMPFRATLLCVLVPRSIILRIRPIPTSSVRCALVSLARPLPPLHFFYKLTSSVGKEGSGE